MIKWVLEVVVLSNFRIRKRIFQEVGQTVKNYGDKKSKAFLGNWRISSYID